MACNCNAQTPSLTLYMPTSFKCFLLVQFRPSVDEEDVIRLMLRAEEVLVADEDFIIEEDDDFGKS